MELNKFKENLEKQYYNSLEELFDRAKLSKTEREVFYEYKNYCEYWLLRSKKHYSQPGQNFLKRLAAVLINLKSSKVSGSKDSLVKKMFSDKSIHRCYTTTTGIRSTKNSNIIENTYFELEILSFFLEKNFKIQLADDNIIGKKIPEFIVEFDICKINIEAKQLDNDKILDSVLGDGFITGVDKELTEEERDKGYKRIADQIERNYNSAISKYLEIDKNEYFLIFIKAYDIVGFLGKYAIDFLNSLPQQWIDFGYMNLIGIVFPDSEKTYFIENVLCDGEIIHKLRSVNILEYHNYVPTNIN